MDINNNIKEKISEMEEKLAKVMSEKDKAIEEAFKVYEIYYEDKKKEMLKEIGVDYKQIYLE